MNVADLYFVTNLFIEFQDVFIKYIQGLLQSNIGL